MKYAYCPKCGAEFSQEAQELFAKEQKQMACDACPFVLYNNPKPAIGVLIKNDQGEIMLTQRGVAPSKGDWDLPGGFMEYGEAVEESALRELQEELGIQRINNPRIIGSFTVYYANEGRDEETIQVLSLIIEVCIDENEITGASDDILAYQFFAPGALPENIAFAEQKKFLMDYAQGLCRE